VLQEAGSIETVIQYNNPGTIITNPNFGRITGVASTRTGQIGLRLTF
jgi:hypothetical protein